MQFFTQDKMSSLEAKEAAQYIAFAPVVFQATRALRNLGLLAVIEEEHTKGGLTLDEIVNRSGLSAYGVRVLLEAGLGIGLLTIDEQGRYKTTKTAYFILKDEMTNVNMDFVHDICYKGMFDLDKSITNGKPEGLKVFGNNWNTFYEALSTVPPVEQKSWLEFDHFYSSDSFPDVLPRVFSHHPKKILDIGGNTGKWAIACAEYDPSVEIGMVDLPGQLNMAKENIANKGFSDRVTFYERNVLDPNAELPKGYDVIWMSQFLDCFSEDEIVSILTRCREALNEGGQVYIMELFWDKQKYKSSAFSLQMTSLYFTNIANGNSQMYHSGLFASLVEKAGLRIIEMEDLVGVSHSLMQCVK